MGNNIPADVQKVFESYPDNAREQLLKIRQLIVNCAAADETIGTLTETLKWGEPAYLTEETGSGSTVRLGYKDKQQDTVAIYFNCQTTIVKDIQQRYDDLFKCVDNRALLIPLDKSLPAEELTECINMALMYHANKKSRAAGLM